MAHLDDQRLLADLTEPQREAVCFGEGPLLVVAGAGTGKTRVITRRIAWLIRRGVPPQSIVGITFTNKAAGEMRRRVEALVGAGVHVSTFHSFCARLLRREFGALGRDPSFTIYDRADSRRVVRQALRELELDPATFAPADIVDYIGLQKDRIAGPADCEARAVGIEERTMARLYRRYEEALVENNALDFDDLLLKTLEVFRESPGVLRRYQEDYLHVLVDEYQDTNLPQHLIARALQGRHRNITAVGDPDQMIYSWRGARLENLLEFEEDFPGAHLVKLERNYRSTANILRAASACISVNRLRHEKTLWTEDEPGDPVVVRLFRDAFAEAGWVAETVNELVERGTDPAEIAVFYRTKQQSLPQEHAFSKEALPHQVVDSVGFFDRRQVKDLRAYMQLLVNPRDDISCLRVINAPPRGIGAKTVQILQGAAERLDCPLLEAARRAGGIDELPTRARNAVERFWELYRGLSSAEAKGAREFLLKILELTEYLKREGPEEKADTEEIIDMFLGYAGQYDRENPGGGLVGFLEQAALVSDVDGWNAQAAAVPFMTLHSAKGLEFDAVFIVGAEEGLLPHRRALEEGAQGGPEAALEEERRLFYVGMTRARKRLFISGARRRMVQGKEQMVGPSRFLDELPEQGVAREEAPAAGAFAREMASVLQKKQRLKLEVLGAGKDGELACGARVRHPHWGEGEVTEVTELGPRLMVRIKFDRHGTTTMLLARDGVRDA